MGQCLPARREVRQPAERLERTMQKRRLDMATTLAPALPHTDFKPWVRRLVRVGYVAKGIIYTLIGTLAFRLALGFDGGRVTDASGVLRTVLRQPFGLILLGIIGTGILGYAAYQVFEAVADTRRRGGGFKGWLRRSLTIIKGVVYGTVGWEAMRIVLGDRKQSASPEQTAETVMRFPLGDIFLALVGLGVAIYGALQIKAAWQAKFDDDIDERRVRREAPWLLPFGRAGIGARGVILILMGLALARAGLAASADEADGYRELLLSIFNQPYGAWLLGAVAAGLACFGIFQLFHARYARFE
jgi:hypothetical protein